jgi:hypothetical protein
MRPAPLAGMCSTDRKEIEVVEFTLDAQNVIVVRRALTRTKK